MNLSCWMRPGNLVGRGIWISLGKAMNLSCWMRSGNLVGRGIWSLDPPPLGERICMDFLRKISYSEGSDEVRQSGGWGTRVLDPH